MQNPLVFRTMTNFLPCIFFSRTSNQRRVRRFQPSFQGAAGVLPHTIFSFVLEESAMAKKSGSKPMTKTEIMRSISETTGLQKKDVVAVMDSLTHEITKALKGSGIGVFSIPGLVKIERRKVPARPAQKGVKNPFTGELQDRPAKPASVKVRVRALKNLKAMVSG
jgi:nucleoid DNA-binding protein